MRKKIWVFISVAFMLSLVLMANSFAQNALDKDQEDYTGRIFEETAASALDSLKENEERIDKAIEDLRKKLAESPDDTVVLYNLGIFYLMKYRYNGSVDQSLKQMAEEVWAKAIELDSEYEEKIKKVREVYKNNDIYKRNESFKKDIEVKKIFFTKFRAARQALELAEKQKDLEKCEEAIVIFKDILKQEHDNIVFLFLGNAYKLKFTLSGSNNTQLLKKAISNWNKLEDSTREMMQGDIKEAEKIIQEQTK